MIKSIYIIAFLSITSVAIAGDYMLYIADDLHTACAAGQNKNTKSSAAVSHSLKQYFSGQKTDIGILHAAFANGHIHFCGKRELEKVYQTLMKLKEKGVSENRSHLSHFIRIIKNIRK